MELEGAIILIPTLVVFVLAILTHRPIESLITGSVVGLVMIHGTGFIQEFAATSVRVMMDETVAWIILVCGFMGSLIAIMIRTGATRSFTERMTNIARSKTSALMATWGLGILMFVDDYMNSLAVGSAMRSLTDKYRVSREKLAYVVDSTAAPISVIIPFSRKLDKHEQPEECGKGREKNGELEDNREKRRYRKKVCRLVLNHRRVQAHLREQLKP